MKYKKICALFGAAALSVLTSTTAFAKNAGDYRDVNPADWFYPYVEDVSEKEYMTGTGATVFAPLDNLSRGQLATIIYRIHGNPDTAYESRFPDVPDNTFYSVPVTWANTCGVITGYAEGTFGPENDITREQLATMLYRYAVKLGYNTSEAGDLNAFPDAGNVSDFAKEAMKWANGVGIITGDSGKLNPQGTVNRAVGATMISRFNGLVGGTKHVHNWVQQYKTVTDYTTVTDYETRPVYENQPIYENRPIYETRPVIVTGCGLTVYSQAELIAHQDGKGCYCGYHGAVESVQVGVEQVQVGTQQVQVGTQQVAVGSHQEACGSHQEPNGYACSCGATR